MFNPILVPAEGTDYHTEWDVTCAWNNGHKFWWPARSEVVSKYSFPSGQKLDIRYLHRKKLTSVGVH